MNTFLAEGLVHALREQKMGGFIAWCGWTVGFAVIDDDPRWTVTCLSCIASTERPGQVGDAHDYGDKILTVVSVNGYGPEDLVFYEDGTHTKQKHLKKIPRASP